MEDRTDSEDAVPVDKDILRKLEQRLGPIHARQRLGIEIDHEAQVFGQGLTFFHLENLSLAPAIIRTHCSLRAFMGARAAMPIALSSSETT